MRQYKPHLWLLRRVQAAIQHKTLESLHGPLQLVADRSMRGRQDPVHARRDLARADLAGPDQRRDAADRCAGSRPALRPALGRPREGCRRLAGKRPGHQLGLWPEYYPTFLKET